MKHEKYVMGFFTDEASVIETIREMEHTPWPLHQVHSPIPSPAIARSMKLKNSRLDFISGAGILLGFFMGFGLMGPESGDPGFIFGRGPYPDIFYQVLNGILFALLVGAIFTIAGIIVLTILPGYRNGVVYDPKCSGEHWAILSSCSAKEQEGLLMLFIKNKGEVKIIESV